MGLPGGGKSFFKESRGLVSFFKTVAYKHSSVWSLLSLWSRFELLAACIDFVLKERAFGGSVLVLGKLRDLGLE
jgi:hypothetical protein